MINYRNMTEICQCNQCRNRNSIDRILLGKKKCEMCEERDNKVLLKSQPTEKHVHGVPPENPYVYG